MAEPTPGIKAWIDTETTGLDVETDLLLEIAVIITTDDLTPIAEFSAVVAHDISEVRAICGEYVTAMHTRSGLFEALAGATKSLAQVEAEVIAWLGSHDALGTVVAGSNAPFDRRFLAKYMPELNENALHYRTVDVSTVKELARGWAPEVYASAPVKSLGHRALEDIRESIEELNHYRKTGFLSTPA